MSGDLSSLLSGWTGLFFPLLLLIGMLVLWLFAGPREDPPALVPARVHREPSPDTVSTVYNAFAAGRFSIPVEFVYQRFAAGVQARHGVYPWEIPLRRKKARKLGIERPGELRRLNVQLLQLYAEAARIDGRPTHPFLGEAIWQHRIAAEWKGLKKALEAMEGELPELWSGGS